LIVLVPHTINRWVKIAILTPLLGCLHFRIHRKQPRPDVKQFPDDAKLELLERSPGVFPFIRMIHWGQGHISTQPDSIAGPTIEMGASSLAYARKGIGAPQFGTAVDDGMMG
jgi:hypothetical protein